MKTNTIIGTCLRDTELEWTAVRGKKDRHEVLEHTAVPLTPDSDLPNAELNLKKGLYSGPHGQIWATIPSNKVLLRVIQLPTADMDELQSMVDLQVDKSSPFPIEEMVVTFEIIKQEEASTCVLIAAVKRDVIEEIGTTYTQAGLLPSGIDIDILAWWEVLRTNTEINNEAREAIIIIDGSNLNLIVLQSGIPIAFQSLGKHNGLEDPVELEELAEDLTYTLTSLETEWGVGDLSEIKLWAPSALPAHITTNLQEYTGIDVRVNYLIKIPPLSEGLALRALQNEDSKVNLALPEWSSKREKRHLSKIIIISTALILAVWVGLISSFLVVSEKQNKKLNDLKDQATLDSGEVEALVLLEQKVLSLEQYAARTHSALECFREISVSLPNGVELGSLNYKKGKNVSIRGQANNVEPVYELISTLEESGLFSEVKAQSIASKVIRGKNRVIYKIEMILPGRDA